MKLEYDVTLDEIADAHVRAYRRLGQAWKWRWGGAAATVALVGLAVGAVVGGSVAARAAWAAPFAVAAGAFFFLTHPAKMRKAVRRLVKKQLRTDGPIHFELELLDSGLRTRMGGTETTFDWSNVEAVEDAPDAVTIQMADGGLLILRPRAFPTPAARQAFLDAVRLRMADAVGGRQAGLVAK